MSYVKVAIKGVIIAAAYYMLCEAWLTIINTALEARLITQCVNTCD